ncbi:MULTISPECIES: YgfZ/GcvT domain-containing protein [Psychrobacter]|uniref:Folate-binding Fe/S cluster repair protein n=1 Tax=Psychrobacter sanguinis TaxID=861445 RepID=A0A844LYV3_9GAMM|nr:MULTISPECIES: folate-binding Fe/S cluster repair protein [Psychrobacter]MUG31508.1 folate-binding Fe/S cluster repair protein [Psychrobacter sanguinis]
MSNLSFKQITLQGDDAAKFLQGQITVNVNRLTASYQPAAIANLKGRIEFGLWIKKQDDKQFDIVISSDCLAPLQAHLKKFGAFSKFTISEPIDIYPYVVDEAGQAQPTFSENADEQNMTDWMSASIATGNYWITEATQTLFQPQELRLHQRGGVDYDKGCYLGQEVIARIYFKAAPKAFLHRVKGTGAAPKAGESLDKIQVVNAIDLADGSGYEALVVARPEQLEQAQQLHVLDLPPALQASVARDA